MAVVNTSKDGSILSLRGMCMLHLLTNTRECFERSSLLRFHSEKFELENFKKLLPSEMKTNILLFALRRRHFQTVHFTYFLDETVDMLDVSSYNKEMTDDLFQSIGKLAPNIRVLILSGCKRVWMCPQNVLIQQISNAGFAQLFRVFSQTKSLMQLTLNGCAPLSDESELANLLTNSTSLRSLSLSGIKNISSQIIPCISRFQIKTFSTITN